MNVLEHQNRRAIGGHRAQRLARGQRELEAPRATRALFARDGVREPEQLSHNPDLARLEPENAEAVHLGKPLRRRVAELETGHVAKHIRERAVVAGGLRLVASPAYDRDVLTRRDGDELRDQPRLARARLAHEEERRGVRALGGASEPLGQRADLVAAPRERRPLPDRQRVAILSRAIAFEARLRLVRDDEGSAEHRLEPGRHTDMAGLAALDERERGAVQALVRLDGAHLEARDAAGGEPHRRDRVEAGRALEHHSPRELERRASRVDRAALDTDLMAEDGFAEPVERRQRVASEGGDDRVERIRVVRALLCREEHRLARLGPDPPRHRHRDRVLLRARRRLHRGHLGPRRRRDQRRVVVRAQHEIHAELVRARAVLRRKHLVHGVREVTFVHLRPELEEQLVQVGEDRAGRRVPLLAVPGERLLEDRDQPGRDAERAGVEARHVGLAHAKKRLARRLRAKEPLADDDLVQDDPEREQVAALVERLSARLLGRHVRVLAAQDLRILAAPEVLIVGARDPEVRDLHGALVAEQNVLWRDVTVNDAQRATIRTAPTMCVVERFAHLADDPELELERQPFDGAPTARLVRHGRAEVFAVQVLHRDEVRALLFAEVEDLDDVRMAQQRRDLRFADEELGERLLRHQRREHALDDDGLLEAGDAAAAGAPNLGHAALADAIEQLVRPEQDRLGHPGRRVEEARTEITDAAHGGVCARQSWNGNVIEKLSRRNSGNRARRTARATHEPSRVPAKSPTTTALRTRPEPATVMLTVTTPPRAPRHAPTSGWISRSDAATSSRLGVRGAFAGAPDAGALEISRLALMLGDAARGAACGAAACAAAALPCVPVLRNRGSGREAGSAISSWCVRGGHGRRRARAHPVERLALWRGSLGGGALVISATQSVGGRHDGATPRRRRFQLARRRRERGHGVARRRRRLAQRHEREPDHRGQREPRAHDERGRALGAPPLAEIDRRKRRSHVLSSFRGRSGERGELGALVGASHRAARRLEPACRPSRPARTTWVPATRVPATPSSRPAAEPTEHRRTKAERAAWGAARCAPGRRRRSPRRRGRALPTKAVR